MKYTLYSLLALLLSLWLGHRMVLARERRKEFNAAARPIRAWLISEAKKPSPYSRPPSSLEIDTFINCLSWKRRGFRKAYARQQEERKKVETQDIAGGFFYRDDKAIIEAVNVCLSYTNQQ